MQGERARLAGFFGVDDGALDARSVADPPDAAAGVDIVAILGADGLPPKRNALRRNGLRGRYGGSSNLRWAGNDCLNVPASSAAGGPKAASARTRAVAGDWSAVGRSVHPLKPASALRSRREFCR